MVHLLEIHTFLCLFYFSTFFSRTSNVKCLNLTNDMWKCWNSCLLVFHHLVIMPWWCFEFGWNVWLFNGLKNISKNSFGRGVRLLVDSNVPTLHTATILAILLWVYSWFLWFYTFEISVIFYGIKLTFWLIRVFLSWVWNAKLEKKN